MANFLRSFATGFVTSANQRFAEDRKLQIANDAAKQKLFREKVLPEFSAQKIDTAATKKKKEDAAALRAQLGISPTGEARIQSGLGTAEDALKFRQSLTPEQRTKFDAGTFTPGQPGRQSLEEFAASRGLSVEDIQKAGIDPSQFPGQAAVSPQFTGPGVDIAESGQTPQELRIQKLAADFVGKPAMFGSDKDFQQAKRAFSQGDMETVIDLTARSPRLQNDIFLPIVEKVLATGIKSLTPNERLVLDLFKTRDHLDQMINMILLQNEDTFREIITGAIEDGTVTEPPPADASNEENITWWDNNIAPMLEKAREIFNEKIRGR